MWCHVPENSDLQYEFDYLDINTDTSTSCTENVSEWYT